MGLNISLYNLSQVKDPDHPWSDIISDERFDYLRYAGDREFVTWLNEGNAEYRALGGYDRETYERPRDVRAAREWVKAHIVEENQRRWLDLFDWLEADTKKHLWLQESW